MKDVFICDAIRTPIGRYGGALAPVRPDDMAAFVIRRLLERNHNTDPAEVSDVMLGCANQAGEDNRNVARMALLLAGMPETVPGVTINRLCGSGMDAIGSAARSIRSGEASLVIAGGVESMSRAPMVIEKSSEPFSRNIKMFDTTLGWRFINKAFDQKFGTEAMFETAENIAREMNISRMDQDTFAYRSQKKASEARENGGFNGELISIVIHTSKGEAVTISRDEHPRLTTPEKLSSLKPLAAGGTITAGNSSGINDGAAALLLASEEAVHRHRLSPLARVVGMEAAGVSPRLMGLGPVPASRRLMGRLGLTWKDIELIELNEAFAAQALGCLREMGLADDDPRINPMGGAIALGHPLGMSGARLVTTATHQMQQSGTRLALCTMCIGVGQGISMVIERV